MEVTIRALTRDEWRVWRQVRLRALADSPDSFRSTLDESKSRSDGEWREQVEQSAEHERATLLVAEAGGEPLGMLFGLLDETLTELGMHAMWVAPEIRRRGVASRLIETAMEWARSAGATRAEMWVTVGNDSARQLYLHKGFRPTTETQQLRDGSSLRVLKLVADL